MLSFNKVRFVLINTTHPGNIGASARAIKNMGFNELYLVAPRHYPHPEATARSSGAEDILEKAVVVSSFKNAIADCSLVIGTSSRERALPIPLLTPRECALKTQEAVLSGNQTAILFGQERMGLTNEELAACHYHLFIPCNPSYASLNLAQAVQLIAYELRLAFTTFDHKKTETVSLATADEMEKFYTHLEQTLIEINFLNSNNPRQLMRKLRRLFNRAALEQNEMNILRGILSMINKRQSNKL